MEYTRQLGVFDPKQFHDKTVAIIGCGAIGSITAVLLAKLGFRNFTLFDEDKIENHNLPNQFYFIKQNGKPKAQSLKEMIELFSDDIQSVEIKGNFTKSTVLPYNITITALDNMKFRKIAFENAQKFVEIFIDARMGGQVFRLYTINIKSQDDIKLYLSSLYDDKKTTKNKYTQKSIIFNTMGIASFIGKNITAVLTGKPYYREVIMDYYNMELLKLK